MSEPTKPQTPGGMMILAFLESCAIDAVLATYPRANCMRWRDDRYEIYPDPGAPYVALAVGESIAQAWMNAAARVSEDRCRAGGAA